MAGETPKDEADFNPDVVRHVAQLARLDLDEERVLQMAQEVGRILEAARTLQALDLTGEEAVYHVGWEGGLEGLPDGSVQARTEMDAAVGSGLRRDLPGASLPQDRFLAQAPRSAEVYVVVPTVVDRT